MHTYLPLSDGHLRVIYHV